MGFFRDLIKAVGNDITKAQGDRPSVVTNMMKGRAWNANLPNFGGIVSPLPERQSIPSVDNKQKVLAATTARKIPLPTPTKVISKPKPTPTPFPTPALSQVEQKTYPTFDKYNIPREVAYGVASAEGGNIGNNNIYNLNATDANPTGAYHFDSPEAAATSAAQLMQKMINAKGAGKKSANDKLLAIQNSGFAGDPKTWKVRSASTGGAGKTFNSWAEFVKATKGYQKWNGVKYK